MVKDEILNALSEIGTCEDDVTRRGLIATLSENVGKDYDLFETSQEQIKSLTEDLESTRKENMQLFLQVTRPKDANERMKDATGIEEKPIERRKFDDLFNEHGGIK